MVPLEGAGQGSVVQSKDGAGHSAWGGLPPAPDVPTTLCDSHTSPFTLMFLVPLAHSGEARAEALDLGGEGQGLKGSGMD